jgi:hypothetical protein
VILLLIFQFFYYNVLHIWSNTIFTTTRIRSQPFRFMGRAEPAVATAGGGGGEFQSRFVEYVFISSNSWFLGKMKTFKTTILILPRRLIQMIEGQGKQLHGKILDPIDAAAIGKVGLMMIFIVFESSIGCTVESTGRGAVLGRCSVRHSHDDQMLNS